ncbi:MAG TPA: DUF58 domain-containing protein [Labilithrix sp.]|nr:DUF58 domain-containing protein [Labilithrix sp.]
MRTLYKLFRAGFHTGLLFVLPWLTGALTGMAFDVREVSETSGQFASVFAMVIVPLLLLQVVAIAIKVGREVRAQRAEGRRGFAVFVEAVDRHVRILTGRGIGMALISLLMVAIALSAKWGQFGVLAVAGLGIMYIASTSATLVSAFAVRAFDDRVRRGRGAIDREMSPTVVDAGDAVEERFFLARVPVPPGFRLHIEEQLPYRLGGDTRFALDRSVSRAEVTVSAPLPRTPRGVYRLGPADIWYEDILGLTRVYVASRASTSLRSLPRLRPVVFERKPRSSSKSEGPLSVLSRIATEEHFRTRPYVSGDDLRRVHWKQSINTGNLMVRVPEAIPFAPTRVRLVLDTFLPPGWRIAPTTGGRPLKAGERAVARAPDVMDDVLDLLVEGWIGLAHVLVKRGEKVTLVAPVREGNDVIVREIECKRGEERKWRAIGADAAWQHSFDTDALLARVDPKNAKAGSIVVSAGLFSGGTRPAPGTSFVIADGASVVPDAPRDDLGFLRRFFVSDYPVGADDNKLDLAKLLAPRPPKPEIVRAELARATAFAIDHARGSSVPVSIVRRRGLAISLETP